MTSYPVISQFTEKQVVTHLDMNKLVDAIGLIRTPARYYYLKNSGDADLTIATTSATDLGSPFTVASLDLSGRPVEIQLYAGRHTTTATLTEIDLLIDGVSVRGGTAIWRGVTNVPINMKWIADSLSAGTHSFKIQWRIVGTGTSTLFSSNGVWFQIVEI